MSDPPEPCEAPGDTQLFDYLNEALDSRQEEIHDLERKLAQAQEELSRAQDHIFRLQPQRIEITESEATRRFEAIISQTTTWVMNMLDPILQDLDSGVLEDLIPPKRGGERIFSLMHDAAKDNYRIQDSDEYHFVAIIMQYLLQHILDRPFYCSPTEDPRENGEKLFIDGVFAAMVRLPRDLSHCRDWKSETLTALSSQPSFKEDQAQDIQDLSSDLTEVLLPVLPVRRTRSGDLQDSVRTSIIEPSVKLAQELQLATKIYRINWPARVPRHGQLDTANYTFQSLSDGGKVWTPSQSPGRRGKRSMPTCLFATSPGLYVADAEAAGRSPQRVLVKPKLLVYDGEVEKTETVLSWLSPKGPPRTRDRGR